MDLSNIKIETERLLLVSASREYASHIFSGYSDSVAIYMNYPPPNNLEILTERMIQREVEMKEGLILYLAVLLKTSGEFLGSFALEDLHQRNPEMGGWLKDEAQGKGFGKETIAALKKWADENLDYLYAKWPCAKENIASCKLAESLGGKITREYIKTNHIGFTWNYREYHLPKNG